MNNLNVGSIDIGSRLHSDDFELYFQIWGNSPDEGGEYITNHGRVLLPAECLPLAYHLMSGVIAAGRYDNRSEFIKPLWELMQLAGTR